MITVMGGTMLHVWALAQPCMNASIPQTHLGRVMSVVCQTSLQLYFVLTSLILNIALVHLVSLNLHLTLI